MTTKKPGEGIRTQAGQKSAKPAPKPKAASQRKGTKTAPPDVLTPLRARSAASRAADEAREFKPTPDQRQLVMLGVTCGLTEVAIASMINWPQGISPVTLRRYFAEELDHGAEVVLMKVAGNLVNIAMKPDHPKSVHAAMFLLKSRAGWSDGVASTSETTVNVTNTTLKAETKVLNLTEVKMLAAVLNKDV